MATLESRILNLLHPEPLSYMALCNIIPDHSTELYRAAKRLEGLGRIKVTRVSVPPGDAVLELKGRLL